MLFLRHALSFACAGECWRQIRSTSRMSLSRSLSLGLAFGLLATTAASAAPAMSTIWQDTTLDLGACVKQAELALHDAGMTKNAQSLRESAYGEQGPYTAAIRCLTGKGIVFMVVSGPRQDRAVQYIGMLKSKF
jgi:hypothetical protein